jgi:hypothetical protein
MRPLGGGIWGAAGAVGATNTACNALDPEAEGL